MDKCIECGLCVEACSAQRINAIGFAERGEGTLPVTGMSFSHVFILRNTTLAYFLRSF
jgi:ferredoxin